MKVVGDKILVKILKQDGEKSQGGLFIPDAAYKKYRLGKIVAVGSGARCKRGKAPFSFTIGDLVLIPQAIGVEHEIDGEEHLFLQKPEENIVVVLK